MKAFTQKQHYTICGVICIFAAFLTCMSPTFAQAEVDTIKVATFEQDLDTQEAGLTPLGKYIEQAKNLYFKTFTESDSQETRDAGFLVFYTYYTKILEKMNNDLAFQNEVSFSASEEQRTKAAAMAAHYGFKIEHLGEGTFGAVADTNYLVKTFGKLLSPDFKAYFAFVKKSQGYISDAAIIIGHDELRQLIILGDAIVKKYSDSELAVKVKKELQYMIGFYLSGVDNTPIYGGGRKLLPEVKASFEKFLKENKSSTYYPVVKAVYALLKKNNFKVTNQVLSQVWETKRKMLE